MTLLLLLSGGASSAAPNQEHLQGTVPAPTAEPTIPAPRPMRIRFSGNIDVLPNDLLGEWVVGGISVTVTADTVIVPQNDVPKLGDWASVMATRLYDGSLTADHIRYQDSSQVGAHPVEFKGLIQAVALPSLVVNGTVVHTDAQTTIVGTPAPGLLAEVRAFLQPDNSVLARRIEVYDPSEIGIEFEGQIEAFPPSPFVGEWLVDGTSVLAIEGATEFLGAEPQIGLYAEVSGILAPDGSVHAKTIRVVDPSANSVEGIVDQIGESEWIIAGTTVGVDQNTLIDESRARAAPGVHAEATVSDQGNGNLLAIRIRLERPW